MRHDNTVTDEHTCRHSDADLDTCAIANEHTDGNSADEYACATDGNCDEITDSNSYSADTHAYSTNFDAKTPNGDVSAFRIKCGLA